MATPLQAELEAQLQNIVKLVDEIRLFGQTTATNNFNTMQDVLEQSLEGDQNDLITASVRASRGSLAATITALGSALVAHIRDWGRFINSDHAEGDFNLLFTDWYDFFVDNALTVERRNITKGAPVAGGGNIGDGEVLRLNEDRNAFDIENVTLESKEAKCIRDQNSGTRKSQEVFRFKGDASGRDIIEDRGSGAAAAVEIRASHPDFGLLRNPSFDVLDGTSIAVLTSIPNWDIDTGVIGDFELDETDIALPSPDDNTTVRSLQIQSNVIISQKIKNTRQSLRVNVPKIYNLWFNVTPGAITAGTLRIRMGSQTITEDLSLSAAGWNELRIALDTNLWFENFNEDDFDITVETTGLTGNYLLVDDAFFGDWENHDGSWYKVMPGRTEFLRDDLFTFTDSAAVAVTEGKIQRTLNFFFRRFLPHAAVGTITDPV